MGHRKGSVELHDAPQMSVNVKKCARCENDHDGLEFHKLATPVGDWTHAATCPTTGLRILLRIEYC